MKHFEIKSYHLKLLKNSCVWWDETEYGSPGIDPKRPYGNSDVISDIARILKIKPKLTDYDDEECLSREQERKLDEIHREMETVLQICLSTQKFKVGKYKKTEKYGKDGWKLVK